MDENCNARRGKSLLRKIVCMGKEKKILKNLQVELLGNGFLLLIRKMIRNSLLKENNIAKMLFIDKLMM